MAELRAAHAAILDGIRDKDPGAAAEAMRAHLADTLAASSAVWRERAFAPSIGVGRIGG